MLDVKARPRPVRFGSADGEAVAIPGVTATTQAKQSAQLAGARHPPAPDTHIQQQQHPPFHRAHRCDHGTVSLADVDGDALAGNGERVLRSDEADHNHRADRAVQLEKIPCAG